MRKNVCGKEERSLGEDGSFYFDTEGVEVRVNLDLHLPWLDCAPVGGSLQELGATERALVVIKSDHPYFRRNQVGVTVTSRKFAIKL